MTELQFLSPVEIYRKHLQTIQGINFSNREIDVIACILHGRRTSKISELLSISPKTIEVHIRNITEKLNRGGSREVIIDFIEHSNNYQTIKDYYFALLLQSEFEKRLKELSKKIAQQTFQLTIYVNSSDVKIPRFVLLSKHIKLAGIKVPQIINHQSHEIFLTWEKDSIEQKYTFLERSDYYLSFFVFLKLFMPDQDLGKFEAEFLELRNNFSIKGSHPPMPREHSESISTSKNNNLSFKKIAYSLSVILILAIGAAIYSINNHTQNQIIARSDLIIPNENVLLKRASLLKEIKNKLNNQNNIRSIALIGPGGAGKTTLARFYALQQKVSIIWEINAETIESLRNSFEFFASHLAKSDEENKVMREILEVKDPKKRADKVLSFTKEKLRHNPNWLLIFDNVEKFSDIQSYFPSDPKLWGKGQIILTSRDQHLAHNNQIRTSLLIQELNPQEKQELFAKIIGTDLINTDKEDQSFVSNLPPFPLDIAIAANYLKSTHISLKDYLKNLNSNNSNFLETQENILKEATPYTKSRYEIISTSIKVLLNEHKDFGDLLLLISLLDSQNIPRDLLESLKDKPIVDNFIHHLKKYSLLTNESNPPKLGSSFSLHRSTQEISLNYLAMHLPEIVKTQAFERITLAFENHFERVIDEENFRVMNQLLPHINSYIINKDHIPSTLLGALESELGCIYYYQCMYDVSLQKLNSSLTHFRTKNKRDLSRVARAFSHLAKVFRETGQYNLAKDTFYKSLLLYENNQNDVTLEYARTLGYLGYTYRDLANFEKAQHFLKTGLNIYNQKNGSITWQAWFAAHLGCVEQELGNYSSAKELLAQSLKLYEGSENHKRISWVISKLGQIEYDIGNYMEAKALLEKALLNHQKLFSENHSFYAWAKMLLGIITYKLNDQKEAKNNLYESLRVFERLFGDNNIRTLGVYVYLGNVYLNEGNINLGIQYINKTIEAYEQHFGKDHFETAKVLRSRGRAYIHAQKFNLAEESLNRALAVLKELNHPEAYEVQELLADLNQRKGEKLANDGAQEQANALYKISKEHLIEAQHILNTSFPKDSSHVGRIKNKIEKLRAVY